MEIQLNIVKIEKLKNNNAYRSTSKKQSLYNGMLYGQQINKTIIKNNIESMKIICMILSHYC